MTKNQLLSAHERIKPSIHRTPVLTSSQIDRIIGARVFFKCENFQKMGAFKMRGATNAILQLTQEEKKKGVVTHSSGNHAQAIALAARSAEVKATIVMPSNAPEVKKEAVKGYGGEIVLCGNTALDREKATEEIVAKTGATMIHPSNDLNVIIGQGTVAIEMLEECPDLKAIITPVGGGGLLAGTTLAAQYFSSDCKIFAGEPSEADDAFRSLQTGKIENNKTAHTIADGLRTHLGDVNFPIIQKGVERIILVSEIEILQAMKLIWTRLKIVCEPSCAVPLAALIKEKEQFTNQKIGIIITGGNVDLENLPFTHTSI